MSSTALLTTILIFLSGNFVFAQRGSGTIICEIPSSEVAAFMEITFGSDGNYVEVMTHVTPITAVEGELTEERKIIYDKSGLIRGGFKAEYCQPDQNEYLKFSDKYSMWAQCKAPDFPQQVIFESDFSVNKTGGIVSYTKSDGSFEDIGFDLCK